MACVALRVSTLTGTVHNPAGEAMPFVTISLLAADSSLVGGTITADDGAFSISLPADACLLRASYMGYVSQEHSLQPIPTQALRIILEEATETLAEVVVESKQKLVERRMDKIVMNVAASLFALGNNGKDIMKKTLGVKIDRKGKITVNGKAVEICIDGHPSYLSGAQLKSMLEGTDGSTIDRLEIITQPSAKNDAARQGGIINIRTKRNKSKGINGSLSGSYYGMYWRDLAHYMQEDHFSLSLHYRGMKTYTSANLSQQCSDNIETFRSEVLTPTSTRLSTYRARTIRQYYMLQLGNDWHIDSLNTLGIGLSMPLSLSNGQGLPEHNHSTLTGNGIQTERNTEAQQLHSRWLQPGLNLH